MKNIKSLAIFSSFIFMIVFNSCEKDDAGKSKTNIYPGSGVEDVAIYDTFGKVKNIYGEGEINYGVVFNTNGISGQLVEVAYKSKGLSIVFMSKQKGNISDTDLLFDIVIQNSFEGQIDNGIKIGSSKNEVEGIYGTGIESTNITNYVKYIKYENEGVGFAYENEKVNSIWIF